MSGQPRYPNTGEDIGAEHEPRTGRQWRSRILLILIVVVVLLVMLILHLTGTLGPGTNG